MLGELTPEQINAVLFSEVVGRIGCYGEGRPYVVPIIYVFDGEAVYAHSAEGLKIRIMRANPNVCFQVDQRENLADWRSVVAWGVYEELQGQEALDALQILVARLIPLVTSETLRLPDGPSLTAAKPVIDAPKAINLPHSPHRENRPVREAVIWLCLLKSPFMLRLFMLQPTMDRLLDDHVGTALAPPDPRNIRAFALGAPA